MRVVFMGTPEFAVNVFTMLVANKFEIAAVYTQPDKAAGRGQTLAISPVKTAALELGLPLYQPESLKSPAEQERLAGFKPDAIIVAAYGLILPKAVLQVPLYGCLNIHPSLLPRYRGVAPVPAAILNGDEFTGVSIMLLDKGVDTGPILARAQIPVNSSDNTGILMEKLSYIGAQLLLDVVGRLEKREIEPRPQDNSLASYTRMLEKADGEINWQKSAVEIARQVRAFQPWPGTFTRWQGKQLKIIAACPEPGEGTALGSVVLLPGGAFGIGTLNGILAVEKVQLEGKRVMEAGEFIRGQRGLIGAVLPN